MSPKLSCCVVKEIRHQGRPASSERPAPSGSQPRDKTDEQPECNLSPGKQCSHFCIVNEHTDGVLQRKRRNWYNKDFLCTSCRPAVQVILHLSAVLKTHKYHPMVLLLLLHEHVQGNTRSQEHTVHVSSDSALAECPFSPSVGYMMQESTEAPDLLSQPWSDPDRSSHSVHMALQPTTTAISTHSYSTEHTETTNSKSQHTAMLVTGISRSSRSPYSGLLGSCCTHG